MGERRQTDRMIVDMEITKHVDGDAYCCRACEISPTGIKLTQTQTLIDDDRLIEIEVPLVQGGLTTAIPSRRIWSRGGYEAFAFVGASFAQQAMLERLFGNF